SDRLSGVSSPYDEEIEKDAWADDETPKSYQAPRVNIPQKTKVPEYEDY
ncbi:MAG: photosystem reaction center subunit H, partial [Trichodesmium sp. St17_bin3_1_1]|nr:photosystem reaction center subunit H [Trichodesmium sp. St17_bin3_1_1]